MKWGEKNRAKVSEGNFLMAFIIIVIIITFAFALWGINTAKAEIENRLENILKIQAENADNLQQLEQKQEKLYKDMGVLKEELSEFLDMWQVEEVDLTGYAPLDPNAVEGMCYSGNPNITASGERVVPGITIAAGESYPFGEPVFIEGHGLRVVQDRGGMVMDNHIDLAVWTRAEALELGRGNVKILTRRR